MSTGVLRALLGDEIDRDAYIDREMLLAAVQDTIMCPISGTVLDIRSAVLITAHSGGSSDRVITSAVMAGTAFDKLGGSTHVERVSEQLRERGTYPAPYVTVIDGRDYTTKGVLTVKARRTREAARTTTPPASTS